MIQRSVAGYVYVQNLYKTVSFSLGVERSKLYNIIRELDNALNFFVILSKYNYIEKMGRTKRKNSGQFSQKKISKKKSHVGLFKKGKKRTIYQLQKPEKPTSVHRLNDTIFRKVAKTSSQGILVAPDADNNPGPSMLLRPRKTETQSVSDQYMRATDLEDNEMRLLHTGKVTEMWNNSFLEHRESQSCFEPYLILHKEIKKGLGWKQALKCRNCDYESSLYKLYTEVPKEGVGAKRATCNVGLQVGLQDSSIGNTAARKIIAATNTPPPARASMQRLSNKVGASTVCMNQSDMAERKKQVGLINELRGLPKNSPINVSFDVRYNSNKIVSSKKMGQNASQAIGVVIEHQTEDQQIVGFHLENKLCWTGSLLRNKGYTITCPGHADCSATIAEEEPFSERNIGETIGTDLGAHGVPVRYATTDGDARGAEGISSGVQKSFPDCTVERQADTTHLGQSQFRQGMRATFSEDMFPGETAERRKEQQKMLSLDIRTRSHAILSCMHKLYQGDIHKIAKKMPNVVKATVDCYSGDCRGCRYRSFVCSGGKTTSWWHKSTYLNNCGLRQLNTNVADRKLLESLLNLRLGVESLRLTRLNLDTNKNESVNRALSVSLPKNVNYGRNAKARVNSTVHRLNMGAGDSLITKLEHVGAPITKGRYVARAVKNLQTQSRYHRAYMRDKQIRRRKLYSKIRQMRAYLVAKYKKRLRTDYRKRQLDPKLPDICPDKSMPENKYALRPRTRLNKRQHTEHPYHRPLHHI